MWIYLRADWNKTKKAELNTNNNTILNFSKIHSPCDMNKTIHFIAIYRCVMSLFCWFFDAYNKNEWISLCLSSDEVCFVLSCYASRSLARSMLLSFNSIFKYLRLLNSKVHIQKYTHTLTDTGSGKIPMPPKYINSLCVSHESRHKLKCYMRIKKLKTNKQTREFIRNELSTIPPLVDARGARRVERENK